jgi:hypothetical protein
MTGDSGDLTYRTVVGMGVLSRRSFNLAASPFHNIVY